MESLQQTLDAYNDAADGKAVDRFGKDPEKMFAMRNGPYFAINAGAKLAGFAAMARVLTVALEPNADDWIPAVAVIAAASVA